MEFEGPREQFIFLSIRYNSKNTKSLRDGIGWGNSNGHLYLDFEISKMLLKQKTKKTKKQKKEKTKD